ncbi:GIY-YIG nuclease family protein [Sorangium sp. So ce861]|uniref:GIY-YIG nuclease family protein n=1 Tax=Sorangium sp. So ce861 TaxID=3133323 RepID=UPI003F5E0F99
MIDGTPQGMRTAEVGNWTGLALVCPRTDLARLALRPEVKKTGIYILVGPSETATSGMSVYVGEGDEVWIRLTSHDSNKDFWTHVVVFVSKDENLTKAHVRWLEATLIREIRKAKRAEVHNANDPIGGKLPEADTADMETYFENVRLLLPTLGVNVFAADVASKPSPTGNANEVVLELRWEDARAECVVREGQFVIRQGSLARLKEVESLGDSSRALRKYLRDAGVLAPADGNPNLLRFTQEYAFDSPSKAASVMSGTGLNGRVAWKVKGAGISYKEWQEKLVADEGSDAS